METFEERLARLRSEIQDAEDERVEDWSGAAEDFDFFAYTPYRHKDQYQLPWWTSDKPVKLILAGNQVGKTLCLIIKVLTVGLGVMPWALGGRPGDQPKRGSRKGVEILLAGESTKSVKKTFVPKLEHFLRPEWIEKTRMGDEGFIDEYTLITGAKIVVWTYRQSSDTWEGPQWNFVGLDEPPPKTHFIGAERGTMKRKGEIWVTATPLKEAWMDDELIQPAQDPASPLYGTADYFQVDIEQNCLEHNNGLIPHDRIASMLAKLSPEERAAREHGIFLSRTGLEFVYVREETHVITQSELTESTPIVEVIDPSVKRGIWCGWFACHPTDEWDWFMATHIPHGPFSQMCQAIHRMRASLPSMPVIAICDQRGLTFNADSETNKNFMQAFRDNQLIYIRSHSADHSILHDWLRVPPGQGRRPKLVLTSDVASIKQGPLWAFQRFQWNPLDSEKKKYGQAGKDYVDLALYLSAHPGLDYQRLMPRVERASGQVEDRSVARAYRQQRPRPHEALHEHAAKMVIGKRRLRRLNKMGWR